MRRLLPACLAIAVLSAAGGTAIAQEDGVFVDPDSPAGKEYAIPFDEARREAGGGSQGAPGTATPFGEGIERDGDAAPGGGDSSGGDRPESGGGRETGGGQTSSPPAPGGSPGVAASLDQGGSSAALLTGGIALGVLLVGGLVALLVRRTNP